jgi:Icc-related predicted phosphoesterase
LDETKKGKNAGSTYLREIVSKKKPKFHIFGHIHEARGNLMLEGTIYLNVARHPKTLMI